MFKITILIPSTCKYLDKTLPFYWSIQIKQIIIIGAGPAGLTAAIELQRLGEKNITIIEADSQVGGISKTINHKGNRIDIGGHRFFSKSDWVMNWWLEMLPIEKKNNSMPINLAYQGQSRTLKSESLVACEDDNILLVRKRLSRIYFKRNFFDYPLKLNIQTLSKLGVSKVITFGFSYVWAQVRRIKPEISLEDFLSNRFGNRLYKQFFKEYTEKVWGVPCSQISAEWGAQRIKSLSIMKAIWHSFKKTFRLNEGNIKQTSLIESFLYPKYGPGQMWERAATNFLANGGILLLESKVIGIDIIENRSQGIRFIDNKGGENYLTCTDLISTMPIKDLVRASNKSWSDKVNSLASNLAYRDFITVGLLYKSTDIPGKLDDNWIYIQEPGVQVGRVQIFNNWSPFMVADSGMIWLGLEFFCKESDLIWNMSNQELIALGQKEMYQIGLTSSLNSTDAVVIKVPKAYPGYFGDSYEKFDILKSELDLIENLFLIGRNGMHRYNNQDHSMLTAAEAAKQISSGNINKSLIWNINVGDDYHEESSKK
jgi:protoporphyrinogen oxidase